VHALRHTLAGVRRAGIVLDLQVIRPNPVVEAEGRIVCEIDGDPLFRLADAARAAVDEAVARRQLEQEAVDDHDVRCHYDDGADLLADRAESERKVPAASVPAVRAIAGPCVMRERCRLRRLRVL
jgi:hypothetical protein